MRLVVKILVYYIDKFVELVCSNLLCVNGLINVVGVLKEEMRMLNFLVLGVVDWNVVLVGGVFVVDCDGFLGEIIFMFY